MALARLRCWERSSWTVTTMADGRFRLVDVLAAGAAGTHRVDPEVRVGERHVDILRFRQHRDGGGRSVDAPGGFGRRDALDPMHARLELELGESAAAANLGDDLLVA